MLRPGTGDFAKDLNITILTAVCGRLGWKYGYGVRGMVTGTLVGAMIIPRLFGESSSIRYFKRTYSHYKKQRELDRKDREIVRDLDDYSRN